MSRSGRALTRLGALAVALTLNAAPAAAEGRPPAGPHATVSSPDALRAALDRALTGGDESALHRLLTPGFIYAARGDAHRAFGHALQMRRPLDFRGARVEGDRATLTGALGDEAIVLLARRTPRGWQIDGATADPRLGPAWLNGLELRPGPDADLGFVADEVARALNAGALPERHLRPGFRTAERDGAAAMLDQTRRKGLRWTPRDPRARGPRGAVAVDVSRDGARVDRVWWLAERSAAGWQIAALTEDPDRIDAVLAGRVPARFEIEALPTAPGPADLAARLRAALLDRRAPAAIALFGPAPARPPGMGPPRARAWLGRTAPTIRAIAPPAVHALPEAGRAMIRMQITHARDGAPQTETLWVYAGRSSGEWVVVDLGARPSPRWFYAR